MREDQSFSSLTGGSSVTPQSEDTNDGVLSLSVAPRNDTIGTKCSSRGTKVCVTIKAIALPDDDETRAPVDIIASLDRSGSMDGSKIRDCKKTLELMIRNLSSKDRFGVVSYGSDTTVEFTAALMTPANKEKALRKIKAISSDGSTNLSGGLCLAAQELQLIKHPNPVRSIFLLTDGMANIGTTSTEGFVDMVQTLIEDMALAATAEPIGMTIGNTMPHFPSFRRPRPSKKGDNPQRSQSTTEAVTTPSISEPQKPVSLFCFGYGTGHNSEMLTAMANASPGGAYYFVEKDSDVSSAFGDAMGGLLSVVAQSAVVSFTVPSRCASAGAQIEKVFHDQALERDDGEYTVNVGDFYAEESRDIVLDVRLATPSPEFQSQDTPVSHLTVNVTYMDTINKRSAKEGPVECWIHRPHSNETSPLNMHVEDQWLRVLTVEEMAAADRLAASGNLDAARSRLEAQKQALMNSPAYLQESVEARGLYQDIQDVSESFQSTQQYRSVGTHVAKNTHMKMQYQRCMVSAPIFQDEADEVTRGSHRMRFNTKKKRSMNIKFA